MIECKECGCPYDEHMSYCPECGNPTEYSINLSGKSNCPNCGAPLSNSINCDYCGTALPRIQDTKPNSYRRDSRAYGLEDLISDIFG